MAASSQGKTVGRPLSGSDLADLWTEFQACDCDGDGCIDFAEFESLLQSVGSRLAAPQRRAEFQRIDRDGNGLVDLGEFERWWQGE